MNAGDNILRTFITLGNGNYDRVDAQDSIGAVITLGDGIGDVVKSAAKRSWLTH